MSFDVSSLESHIEQILAAPGTDLNTISAKRVRKQLVELDSSLTSEILKEYRDQVDLLIASVFERVSNVAGSVQSGDDSKRKRGEDGGGSGDEDEATATPEPAPTRPKKKGKKSTEDADAELARKLSSEINGRSRRSGGSNVASAATKKNIKRKPKKSAATVDSGSEGEDDEGKTKKPKKKSGGGAKGGFAKEYILSEPLSAVLQVERLSRPQVVKQLWIYIRGNELQNPSNKREIICDEGLRAVFNVDKIDMFRMNKVLGQHLHDTDG